jgi:hypothetical protein
MRYRANPVEVEAFVITQTEYYPHKDPDFILTLDSGEIVRATPAMTSRMAPSPGDYWVIQSDGYIYLNPKEVFERKYSPIPLTSAAS